MELLKECKSLQGKRVLVRVDFNVPHERGRIIDDYKMRATLPTLEYLHAHGARSILVTHFGEDTHRTTAVLARRLAELMRFPVAFVADCVGKKAHDAVAKLKDGDILMLENPRCCKGEMENDPGFAKDMAALGDVFVQDAFGTCHRMHASMVGIPKWLPSYAGMLMAHELEVLSGVMKNPIKPVALLLGGAKVSIKIGVIEKFLPLADHILLGGVMANTFLKAHGYPIGLSLYDRKEVGRAQSLLTSKTIVLPLDVVVERKGLFGRKRIAVKPPAQVEANERILDIGPKTIHLYASYIRAAQTIVWNGPMGYFETPVFSHGSIALARFIASRSKGKAYGVAGGGETISCLQRTKMFEYVDHVSTGGGAMLELLAGNKLPGVEALG